MVRSKHVRGEGAAVQMSVQEALPEVGLGAAVTPRKNVQPSPGQDQRKAFVGGVMTLHVSGHAQS